MDDLRVPDLEGAAQALRDARTVALACHVNPDGDALGSLLGLKLGLDALGKQTYASWGDAPVEVPPSYRFLGGAGTVVQPEAVPETDVFVALDCGGIDRLGSLEPLAKSASVSINIDHHPGNDDFATHNLVVTGASSTAELVVELLRALGATISPAIATCLYTGIVTDTGRFSYQSATPRTLRLAADLLEAGADAPRIATEVFESSPFGYLHLVGRVLDRAVLHADERFIYSWIEQRDLIDSGIPIEETGDLIDLVRSTRDADVAALFKEQDDGTWRVSLRSRSRVIGDIARTRGGGGHDLAAGFTVSAVGPAVEEILAELRA